MSVAARAAAGGDSRSCAGRPTVAKRYLLVGVRLLVDGSACGHCPTSASSRRARGCRMLAGIGARLKRNTLGRPLHDMVSGHQAAFRIGSVGLPSGNRVRRCSAMTLSKWGGTASFVLAAAYIIPSLVYLMGDLRCCAWALGLRRGGLPVWASVGSQPSHSVLGTSGAGRQWHATADVIGNVGDLVRSGSDGCRSVYPLGESAIPSGSPRLAFGGLNDGPRRLDHDYYGCDWGRMALSGLVLCLAWIGWMGHAPPVACPEHHVLGHRCHSLVGVYRTRS